MGVSLPKWVVIAHNRAVIKARLGSTILVAYVSCLFVCALCIIEHTESPTGCSTFQMVINGQFSRTLVNAEEGKVLNNIEQTGMKLGSDKSFKF